MKKQPCEMSTAICSLDEEIFMKKRFAVHEREIQNSRVRFVNKTWSVTLSERVPGSVEWLVKRLWPLSDPRKSV